MTVPTSSAGANWPILTGVPQDELQQALGTARRRRFRANEVIFHEGDPADCLHLIVKGRVSVSVSSPYGSEVTFVVLKDGDVFGEHSLLNPGSIRNATVTAVEATETLSLSHSAFNHLRSKHPGVAWVLAKLLAEQLKRTNGRLVEALFVPVDVRVLRRLVELADAYGDGNRAVIPLTQEGLANLAGSTRATVNRVLRREENRGSLRLDRSRITVLDRTSLARRAGD